MVRATRRAGSATSEAERAPWLISDQDLGWWFGLPYFLMDDERLMEALRPALSRRIVMEGTFGGTLLVGLEDVWCWAFHGRGWVARRVQKALEARRPPPRR